MIGFINRVDKVVWPPQRDLSADVSMVSPSLEQILTILNPAIGFVKYGKI